MRNVFNVLANEGFLRGQGILSLESVQEFYKTIEEAPEDATMRMKNLLDFCNQTGYHELSSKPVITLTKTISRTGETKGHAVVLDNYNRGEDFLLLRTIDSLSKTGRTNINCLTGRELDQWCLASDNCYVFYFN